MTAISQPDDHASDFPLVRRGYDPEAVDGFIRRLGETSEERVAEATTEIADLTRRLHNASQREEAVHLTFVAATRVKEEMLETAKREVDETRAVANEDAQRVLSEAQYEAFRIVTEAREEAEAALAEAHREADTLRGSIADEGASLSAARTEELDRHKEDFARERAELSAKMTHLRSAARDLEARLKSIARGALDDLGNLHMTALDENEALDDSTMNVPSAPSGTDRDNLVLGRRTSVTELEATLPEETFRETTPKEKTPPEEERYEDALPEDALAEDDEEGNRPTRGSFYSRRSARLPRIGADAANAVAAVNAMRKNFKEKPELEEQDLAMQSA